METKRRPRRITILKKDIDKLEEEESDQDDNSIESIPIWEKGNRFKINNKMIFLTYSQCPLKKKIFSEEFSKVAVGKNKTYKILDKIVAMEKHKDGNTHFHVSVVFDKAFQTQSPTRFDIMVDGKVYHPNIRPLATTNDLTRVNQYITKVDSDLKNLTPLIKPKIS